MSTKVYQKTATEIIKDSIKSVVYIDEKAWDPFEQKIYNKSVDEHIISKDLHKNLKKDGINLSIHRFSSGDENLPTTSSLKKYLFNDIDLVVLDWELDDDKLNKASLKLLADIIMQPHIHFCTIYSSTNDFDSIIKKICSYYSGLTREQCDKINEIFESYDEITQLLNNIDITKKPETKLIGRINSIDKTIFSEIIKITNKNYQSSLIDMAIASNKDLPKPDVSFNFYSEIISHIDNEYTLVINNTIITILQKKKNRPQNLIRNFSKHISKDQSKSFFKLLGLNMQSEFSKKGSFINPDILNISFNTFLYHRKQINEIGGKPSFEEFTKNILLENAKINLVNTDLKILNNVFLENFKIIKNQLNDNELASINCFYNGNKIIGNKALNFGDIFVDENQAYYLCITALCDCVIHKGESNVKFKYFFVKGAFLNLKEAFKKGDGGFISYVNSETCIAWTHGEYVKPIHLYVPEPAVIDDKITVCDWMDKAPVAIPLKYMFTLKENYAQRIANQAFSHPVRVGVDFVKR